MRAVMAVSAAMKTTDALVVAQMGMSVAQTIVAIASFYKIGLP